MFTYKKVPKNRVSYEIVMILYGVLFTLNQGKMGGEKEGREGEKFSRHFYD